MRKHLKIELLLISSLILTVLFTLGMIDKNKKLKALSNQYQSLDAQYSELNNEYEKLQEDYEKQIDQISTINSELKAVYVTLDERDLEINKMKERVKEIRVAREKDVKAGKAVPTQSGRMLTVTATAYTAYCKGCSGVTYTGIDLHKNPNQKVIAVDPDVIPLGSKVWVEDYGIAIAGDIGSAINGHEIDVYLPGKSKDKAFEFGRKKIRIKILSQAS